MLPTARNLSEVSATVDVDKEEVVTCSRLPKQFLVGLRHTEYDTAIADFACFHFDGNSSVLQLILVVYGKRVGFLCNKIVFFLCQFSVADYKIVHYFGFDFYGKIVFVDFQRLKRCALFSRAIAYDNAWKFAEITVAIHFRVIYKHYQQTFVVLHLDSVLVLRIVGCLQFGRVSQLRPAAVNVTDEYRSVEVYKYGVVVVVFPPTFRLALRRAEHDTAVVCRTGSNLADQRAFAKRFVEGNQRVAAFRRVRSVGIFDSRTVTHVKQLGKLCRNGDVLGYGSIPIVLRFADEPTIELVP